MSSTLAADGFFAKLALTLAGASMIGGGTMVLNNARDTAVLEQRVATTERTVEKIDKLDEKLDTTLRKVDVLNARLELKEKDDVPRNQ